VEGRPRELTAIVRGEAYRIACEAVSNAYQHAKAGEIETEIAFGDADLTIRVRDDGIGVDLGGRRIIKKKRHWGLPGMLEQLKKLGGNLQY
jgi:signal transduction histidine kinase